METLQLADLELASLLLKWIWVTSPTSSSSTLWFIPENDIHIKLGDSHLARFQCIWSDSWSPPPFQCLPSPGQLNIAKAKKAKNDKNLSVPNQVRFVRHKNGGAGLERRKLIQREVKQKGL